MDAVKSSGGTYLTKGEAAAETEADAEAEAEATASSSETRRIFVV